MPPRILRDILVIDSSKLARNMYELLFSPHNRYRIRFGEEYASLFKKSRRLRPDILIVNSNSFSKGADLVFPCPTILITSRDRLDLKEQEGKRGIVILYKPFYPYDLISIANRLIGEQKKPTRGRKPGRRRRAA